MAVADQDDYGYPATDRVPGNFQRMINLAGAATSLALVIGVAVWGYKLAVRDVSGIPVVRALEGPMRVAPQEPGGTVVDHTGLAVNDIAEEGVATPLPDQMVLAPRPVDLAAEDVAMAGVAPAAPAPTVLASLPQASGEQVALAPLVPVAPVEEVTETPLETAAMVIEEGPVGETAEEITLEDLSPSAGIDIESAVASALAEALAPENTVGAELVAEVGPEGAITRSPRPERRPEGDANPEVVLASLDDPAEPIVGGEVDVSQITAGTRLVQLGAFDDEADARAEWAKLQAQFGELIASKSIVLQEASSGGRSFVRLRALGFDDEADARRFCSALLAENAACIPVAHRP